MAYIGAEPVPGQNREIDDISSGFNGSATAFTLQVSSTNVSPESANNILVNLGGVMQNPGTDYTIAASTITFTTAPASGLSFWALILGAGINTATVADDTIGSSKLIDTAVTAGSYTTADITVDAQGRITAAASGTISGAEIADQAVTNAKVNNSAAIAGTKISPDFGSQNIVTTGSISGAAGTLTGDLTIPDTIVHTGDTNTKIRFPAADTFSVETAGTERMRIDSSGSVGIGVTTPNQLLEVGNSSGGATINISTNEQAGSTGSKKFNNLDFSGFNNTVMARIQSWDESSSTGHGYLTFFTNKNGVGFSEKMRIDPDGQVGIGETSMDALLVIKGSSDESTTPSIRLKDGSDTREAWISNTSGDLVLANGGNDNTPHCMIKMFDGNVMTFKTANTERMRIDNAGRVLIGRTSPVTSETDFLDISAPHTTGHQSVQLAGHTSSSINGSSVLKCNLHGFYRQSYGQNGFLFKNGDSVSNNRGVRIHQYQNDDSTVVGSIFANNASTDFNTSSDYRLKENEVLISDGITRIKQLKPYRFNFKAIASETVDGFFAHEVASVVPHAVGGEKDEMKPNAWYQEGDTIPSGKAVGDVKGYSSTEMEIQQLDYSKLVTVTIAALQEAITKIETLETKVAALEAA